MFKNESEYINPSGNFFVKFCVARTFVVLEKRVIEVSKIENSRNFKPYLDMPHMLFYEIHTVITWYLYFR